MRCFCTKKESRLATLFNLNISTHRNELHKEERGVETKERYSLPARKLALDKGGNGENAHCDKYQGHVDNKRGGVTEYLRINGNVKSSSNGDRGAAYQYKIEDVCADYIAE